MAEECCKTNILKSAVDTAARLVSKPGLATEEQREQRMNICGSCEHFDENRKVCKKCGCFLELKTKFSGMKCPIGKWNEV